MDDALRAQLRGLTALNPQLLDVEKEELRMMALEGRPLYKIVKSAVDYADERMHTIASTPLRTPEGVELALQLQLERNAMLNVIQWFVSQFDDPQRVQRKEPSNG